MPLTVRTRLTMPMVIAVLILVSGFVAIAWTVQWSTAGGAERIREAANSGVTAIMPPRAANSIAGALPVFELSLDGAVAAEVPQADARWLQPGPLQRIDVGVGAFVWLDNWWDCMAITYDYQYLPVGVPSTETATGQDAIDIARWNQLTFRQQQNVKGACQ